MATIELQRYKKTKRILITIVSVLTVGALVMIAYTKQLFSFVVALLILYAIMLIVMCIEHKRYRQQLSKRLQKVIERYPSAASFHHLPDTMPSNEIDKIDELISKGDDWWRQEDRLLEQKQRKKQQQEEAAERKKKLQKEINQSVQRLKDATNHGDVDTALEEISKLKPYKKDNVPIVIAINNFEKIYEEGGFGDSYEIVTVDYDIPKVFNQAEWHYPVAKFPKRGCPVVPYRRRKVARRGYSEYGFQAELERWFGNELSIIGDCSIHVVDEHRPYEPDIAIVVNNRPSIRLDIEIDEPYAPIDKKPIHFIGCDDDYRDRNLNNRGWIVIRFSEEQVVSDAVGCVAFIAQVLHIIDGSLNVSKQLIDHKVVQSQNRWTEIEAQHMCNNKWREKYLNHIFKKEDVEIPITVNDITLTDKERVAANLVHQSIYNTTEPFSFKREWSNRDGDIQFIAKGHIYLYRRYKRLRAVSDLIAYYFKPFDSIKRASYKANERRVDIGQVLEEWDSKGKKAAEVGTFMHKQIENSYAGLCYEEVYHYSYSGTFIEEHEDVSLRREHEQFIAFQRDNHLEVFATEWSVYDEELDIAGTIDMLCKSAAGFEMYDWKRTTKVVDAIGHVIDSNAFGDKGIRGLETVPDTPYWRYCLQQNMYRYILEKKYDISINKMYLVVLHAELYNYVKVEVPRMDREIRIIVQSCSSFLKSIGYY